MDTQEKLKFPRLLRELRVARRLKQREVAEAIGLASSSYGNCEVNNHRTMSRDKVARLTLWYSLSDAEAAEVLAAWDDLPESDYNKRQAKSWEERRAFRSKARNHDRLFVRLLELTTLLVATSPEPDALCVCPPDDEWGAAQESCELCAALEDLGIGDGWTTRDEVIAKLAAIQEAMTA